MKRVMAFALLLLLVELNLAFSAYQQGKLARASPTPAPTPAPIADAHPALPDWSEWNEVRDNNGHSYLRHRDPTEMIVGVIGSGGSDWPINQPVPSIGGLTGGLH
jgi:hypothetical protein